MNQAQLAEFYETQWQRWLREDPTLATSVGDVRYNDRWPDLSPAALRNYDDDDRSALEQMRGVDANGVRRSPPIARMSTGSVN